MSDVEVGLSFQPLYRQAIELIVRRIALGEWRPGTLLPSEPRLAEQLGVSVGTIRKALQQLVLDGLVERRQGVGTFVATATRERSLFRFFKLVEDSGKRVMPGCEEIARESGPASAAERERLGLAARERVVRIRRLRTVDSQVMMIDDVVLPRSRFAGIESLEEPLPPTLYDFYEQRFGVTVLRVEERLGAIAAGEDDGKLLGVVPGAALLEIARVAFSFEDEPVELRSSRIQTGRYFYLSELS